MMEDANDEIHQRTMQLARDAQKHGHSTINNLQQANQSLVEQGETLERIEDKNEKIARNLEKSDKVANAMSSWGGYFKGLIFGFDSKKDQKKEVPK